LPADTIGMAKGQHALRYRLLPAALRRIRCQASLTQRELARKLRVTHVWVHKSEVGDRRVDVTEFMDWCVACGTDPVEEFRNLAHERRS
jgi:transcriptional regulator with XRE-family HTH domain